MARGIEGNEIGTAKKKAPTLSTQKSSGKQQSIAGFFQKRAAAAPSNAVTPAKRSSETNGTSSTLKPPQSSPDLPASLAAAPSSSSPLAVPGGSSQSSIGAGKNKENGMKDCERFSPARANVLIETPGTDYFSPSRKAKKTVNYAESDDEDDEDAVFKPLSGNGRAAKRRRINVKDESEDEFGFDAATQAAMESDDGMLGPHFPESLLTSQTQCSTAFNQLRVCSRPNHEPQLTSVNQIWRTLLWRTMMKTTSGRPRARSALL